LARIARGAVLAVSLLVACAGSESSPPTPTLPALVTFELCDATCTFPAAQPIADPSVLQGSFAGNGCRSEEPTTGNWTFSRSGTAAAADAASP